MCELLQQIDKLLKTVPHYKVEGYYICKRITTDIQIVTTQSVLMYPVVYNGRKVPPPYLWPSLHLCMYKDTAVHFSDPTLICQRIYEILDLLLVLLYRLRSLCPKTYCTPAKTFLAWVYTKCPGKGDYLQLPGNTSRPTLLLVFLLLGGSLGLPSTSCGLICIDRRNSWKGWAQISQGCAVILRILEIY